MPLFNIDCVFIVWLFVISFISQFCNCLRYTVPLCFFLSRTNPFDMCESHRRPPGLCLFTTSPSHEWIIKSCITIMTHCLSLFLEERLSSVDKWLEFQNNTNLSTKTFCFMVNVFLWVVASQMLCVANVISLSLNIRIF